jgi:hypothetical protein
MKAILTVLTAIAATVAVSTFAQVCDLTLIPNPDLARDCVELAVAVENINAIDCLYPARNIERPDGDDIVQVAVYARTNEGVLAFLGWSWMSADEANYMHKLDVVSL